LQVEHAALATCDEWRIALHVKVRQDADRKPRHGWLSDEMLVASALAPANAIRINPRQSSFWRILK